MTPEPELMLKKIVALILFTITDCCNVAHLKMECFYSMGLVSQKTFQLLVMTGRAQMLLITLIMNTGVADTSADGEALLQIKQKIPQ